MTLWYPARALKLFPIVLHNGGNGFKTLTGSCLQPPLALLRVSSRLGTGLGFSERCVKATATHGLSTSLLPSFHPSSPADADLQGQTYFFTGCSGLKAQCNQKKVEGRGRGLWWQSWAGEGADFQFCHRNPGTIHPPVTGWQQCLACHIPSGCQILEEGTVFYTMQTSPSKPEPSFCTGTLLFFKENKATANQGGKHKHGALTFIPRAQKITKWASWVCFLPASGEATVLLFYSLHFWPGELRSLRDVVSVNRCDLRHSAVTVKSESQNSPVSSLFALQKL